MLVNTSNKESSIFATIQGEGSNMGLPAFFIRLQGCSVHCFFCDEKETWVPRENNSKTIDVAEVLKQLEEVNPLLKRVVITGGEPSEQDLRPLLDELLARSYKVYIETAATGLYTCDLLDDKYQDLFIAFSPKEIYSSRGRVQDERIWARCNELRFVIANDKAEDYLITNIISKLKQNQNDCEIFLTPDWYNFEATRHMVMKILENYPGSFRLGVQMHKIAELP